MPNTNLTLAELAVTRPGATRVFLKHHLDFCCGGHRSLDEACAQKGLDPSSIIAEIGSEDAGAGDVTGWAERPLGELVDFIQGHYHRRLREEFPEMIAMAKKVEKVHAEKPTCPRGITDQLTRMHTALLDHMGKEEEILFPMLRGGYLGQAAGPIRVMEQEHEDHGENLAALRAQTHDFVAPPEACATWRALYLRLDHVSDELMEHIHLENNVLFPRALCE